MGAQKPLCGARNTWCSSAVRDFVGALGMSGAGAVRAVEIGDVQWSRFVAGHPDATCFHRPEWVSTLADCYRFRPFVLVQRDRAGEVVAGLPLVEARRPTGARRWSSLPFSDECGPLVGPGGSGVLLAERADALRRGQGVADLQIRADLRLQSPRTEEVAVTHALALGGQAGPAPPAPRLRSSVRRHVATAERLGVQVRFAETSADLVDTYYRLHVQTRRRQGVPAQPRRYFRLLWERMVAPGHGFVVLASTGGTAVAGAVYLLGGRTVTYKYGASDAGSRSLRPNHAVMATAITWAVEHGYSWFDFGRTDLDNEGLMRFKASWGAQARPLRYTYFGGGGGYAATRRVSAALAPVIQRAPRLVCRGLGEVLYRYAA